MHRFLSCDWGSSRFRLRLIDQTSSRIEAVTENAQGIQTIASTHPGKHERSAVLETVLQSGIQCLGLADNTDLTVVISGMASSTLGMHSLPYAKLPAPIDGRTLVYRDFMQSGRKIRLLSGLQAETDVMRGEETELIGLFSNPVRRILSENCVVVLPGTHSKHVRLKTGNITDFTTYITGELYSMLIQHSTLDTSEMSKYDPHVFVSGVQASQSYGLSAALFQTRARSVLGILPSTSSRAFLSGVLIGAEVGELAKISTNTIVLAATDPLASYYSLAMGELLPNTTVEQIPAEEVSAATIVGHTMMLNIT